MGISARDLKTALDALTKIEPRFGPVITKMGYPEPRKKNGVADTS